MARRIRPHMPGGTFHLTARLHSGAPRLTPDLRTEVVELLGQEVAVSDAALFAYVVMPNHLHLVVRQGTAELSELMQPFLRRVALAVRRANGLVGHVFERPFRDRYCAGPGHARNAIVYTHLNPFRAGLCGDAGDYPWSSRGEWLAPTGLGSAGMARRVDSGFSIQVRVPYLSPTNAPSPEALPMRPRILPLAFLLLPAAAASACAGADEPPAPVTAEAAAPALETITEADLLAHIDTLASDAFEGRAPGTAGEEKTVAYLTGRFRAMGLQPGNPDGGWTQDVTLVGIRNQATGSLRLPGGAIPLAFPDDFVAVSYRDAPSVEVEGSELVFVGYGVDAPEYGWDDYAGRDMTGKTLVMLVNDPPVRLAGDTTLDPEMFNGRAMTYYGRWTYKYEVGAEKGADAVIVIHETGPAGYPWEVVTGSWGPEQFGIAGGGGRTPVKVEAWITESLARRMFSAAGQDFDALKERARTPGFQPADLGGTASFRVTMDRRQVASRNVLARLPGSDDDVADELVVYTAHWDHLGRDTTLAGDQIFNGALDNATGTGGLLEIAQAFTALPEPPRRSILFLAVTAEEKGLLGARYYAENPLYRLESTLANINMDGLNPWGRTEDVVVIGMGNSSLDDVLRRHAGPQGRRLVPDPEPEKGFFYRSDHFQFAKQGVPALYIDAGNTFIGKPAEYGQRMRDEYTANDYHKPSDELRDDWDLAGAIEDLELMFLVGYDVAQGDAWPTWSEGTEFRARREAMLDRP